MMKHRRKLLAGAVTAIAITAIAATGATAATAAPAVAGTENFQLMSTSATSKQSSIMGYGVFTAGGTDTRTTSSTDTVSFPNGTFVITHSKGTGTQSFNPKTCLLKVNMSGTYTLGRGTGAYAHISGGRHLPAEHPGRRRQVRRPMLKDASPAHTPASHPRIRAGITALTTGSHQRPLAPTPAAASAPDRHRSCCAARVTRSSSWPEGGARSMPCVRCCAAKLRASWRHLAKGP